MDTCLRGTTAAGAEQQVETYRDNVVTAMQALRTTADELETLVDAKLWLLPTYAEMLFVQ